MTPYAKALNDAMLWLAAQPNTLFLGQAVGSPGTAMYGSLEGVPMARRVELPVIEDAQLGMCIGLSLQGYVPISIYPRWPFLLLATNQMVNHLDKIALYSGYRPKVIVRTAVPTARPLDPGPQHMGDHGSAFDKMLEIVVVDHLWSPSDVVPSYEAALRRDVSTIIVEYSDMLL